MSPKRVNLIPPGPPPGEDDARREWASRYRSFITRWGAQGGFVNKVVPSIEREGVELHPVLSKIPLFDQMSLNLRKFSNLLCGFF
jgi:hypothetical protein